MAKPFYIQIFSMTDHAKALQGRFEGDYHGTNAELQTSEIKEGTLRISTLTKVHQALIPKNYFDDASVIFAYRHSDTGVLNGTSETIYSISKLPWEDMPGFAFLSMEKNMITVKLWDQEMTLKPGKVYRIHFGKTVVFLKNFGEVKDLDFTDEVLSQGPAQLHSKNVDENLTIAPPSGSGMQVKMGQETQN